MRSRPLKNKGTDFDSLVGRIQATSEALQQDALVVINRSVTARAWLTGYYIVEYEQHGADRAKYGENLLKRIEERLGAKGFSVESLKKLRLFYQTYPALCHPVAAYIASRFANGESLITKLPYIDVTPIGESVITQSESPSLLVEKGANVEISPWALFSRLSYTHILQLLPLNDELQRTFYAFEAIRGTWSVRELKRQIESMYYQRCGWAKDPHKYSMRIRSKGEKLNANDFIKTENVLEFLGAKLPPRWEESDLEQSIYDNLRDFILEAGRGFCFEARQQKILIDDVYERIDLVFYHRILKCHVLVELKAKKFNRADAVQLGMYMEYYRKRVMEDGDNPPIGLLLCTEVGKEAAEYIAPYIDERLFISKYQLQLPGKEAFTEFLKKENEGLPQPMVTKKRKAKRQGNRL